MAEVKAWVNPASASSYSEALDRICRIHSAVAAPLARQDPIFTTFAVRLGCSAKQARPKHSRTRSAATTPSVLPV
jgi:hypothetical protein